MPQYDACARTPAPIQTVWHLLQDARTWPTWSSSLDELVVARSRDIDESGLDQVGTVRAFRTGRVVTGERLTTVDPPYHLAYQDEFNPALRDYRADIRLAETEDGGTSIRWTGRYRMKPVTGWVLPWLMPRTMQALADDLAAGATRRFRSGG